MMNRHIPMLTTIAMMLAAAVPAGIQGPDGQAYTHIVIEKDAPDSVKLAASEMQQFIGRLCGVQLPIRNEALEGEGAIHLGHGVETESLPSDGFRIKTAPKALYIAGKDSRNPPPIGPRNPWRRTELVNNELKLAALHDQGTLCGVYAFLEEFGGIRFYWPGEDGIVLQPVDELKLPEIDMTRSPRFSYRYPWFCLFEKDKDNALWFHRAGFGGHAPVVIIHSFNFVNQHQKEHPEFWALVNGKRAFTNECVADGHGHLCLNNPDLLKTWCDDIRKYFDANPEIEVYPIVPNDGLTRICECPQCQADLRPQAASNGVFSYHIWNFVNKVAREIRKTHPNRYIGCLAYEKYWQPPEEIDFEPNVAVMICHSRSSMTDEKASENFWKGVDAWSKKSGRLYFWDWYLNHWPPTDHLPIFYSQTIEREIRKMAANPKICGEFIESENFRNAFPFGHERIGMPGMQHLNLYLTAKLLWNPQLNVKDIRDEYYKLFYGPAEAPMSSFWTLAESMRDQAILTGNGAPDSIFTRQILLALNEYLQQAMKAVPQDSVFARRIKIVNDEFQIGAKRLTRMEAAGKSLFEVQPVEKLSDLDNLKPMRFYDKFTDWSEPPTWLYAGYDRRNLYLKFLCYEPNMSKLRATVTEHDKGTIWDDDCVELFFFTDPNKLEKGYHIIVNTLGTIMDGIQTRPVAPDLSWESNVKCDIVKEETRWIVNVTLPFTSLEINDINFAGEMIVNFYRTRVAGGRPTPFVWSPTGDAAYFVPKKFGRMTFIKAE
ncbi:MAG: DUF4838 domain-containing protein [Victivallales bacterium]|nr:DUF4838 domain-containing protein [Victivallales bacterium]